MFLSDMDHSYKVSGLKVKQKSASCYMIAETCYQTIDLFLIRWLFYTCQFRLEWLFPNTKVVQWYLYLTHRWNNCMNPNCNLQLTVTLSSTEAQLKEPEIHQKCCSCILETIFWEVEFTIDNSGNLTTCMHNIWTFNITYGKIGWIRTLLIFPGCPQVLICNQFTRSHF